MLWIQQICFIVCIRTYLCDRYQSASINCGISTNVQMKYGAPQGSRLGPLLFVIFTSLHFTSLHFTLHLHLHFEITISAYELDIWLSFWKRRRPSRFLNNTEFIYSKLSLFMSSNYRREREREKKRNSLQYFTDAINYRIMKSIGKSLKLLLQFRLPSLLTLWSEAHVYLYFTKNMRDM